MCHVGAPMNKDLTVAEDDSRDHSQRDLPATRYTVVAVASTVADLVGTAGGLLCDRAMRGWTVAAAVHDSDDVTPLTILGVGICCTSTDLLRPVKTVAPRLLVVSRGLLDSDDCSPADLLAHYDFRETEVLVCGVTRRTRPSARDLVEYRLSPASRAFKSHALAAAGLAVGRAEDIERFVRSTVVPDFGAKVRRRELAANRGE
jgi:hypothetical protein